MKAKSVFIIIATVMCALSLWSGVFKVNVDNNDSSGSSLILKIEKNSMGGLVINKVYQKTSQLLRVTSEASSERLRSSTLAKRYVEQPMLYSLLLIFSGSSICIASFLIHMMRTDSRFQ